jgi:dolichol-phosphate mannosyltransferase
MAPRWRVGVGRVVVAMDGDVTHPTEAIPELIRPTEQEGMAQCGLIGAAVGFAAVPEYSAEKARLRDGIRFATQRTRLRAETLLTPRRRRAIAFAGVGLTGLVVNGVAFWLLVRLGHLQYLAAAAAATQVSTTWNFMGMELIVFSHRKSGRMFGRYLRFSVLNNTVMLGRLPLLAFLVGIVGAPQLLANSITLLAVFLVRFVVSDRYIYEGKGD